ncbi:MAG: RIP metalloprotease [Actinobacteria bacterium]|nr:RIP metalloprotease [Actinomycetota bacterium]
MTGLPLTDGDRRVRLLLLVGGTIAFGLSLGMSMLAVVLSFVGMLVVHELGHYLVARWTGMQVTEFFIGFGPRVWSVQRGETEYGIKAIPLGAYVRVTGMTNLEEVDPAHEHRTYRHQSYPKRMALALAGSGMQFVLAVVLLLVIFVGMGRPDVDEWAVRSVVGGTAAEAAGIQADDRILAIAGRPVADFDRFGEVVRSLPGRVVAVEIERDGVHMVRSVAVGERLTGSGAAAFPGLFPGDRIIAVDGVATADWSEVEDLVEVGVEHRLTVHRSDDATVGITTVARRLPTGSAAVVGFFGVSPRHPMVRLGPVTAVRESVTTLGDLLWMSGDALVRFFTPGGLSGFVGGAVDPGGTQGDLGLTSVDPGDDNRLLSIYGAVRLGDAAFESGAHNFLWFLVLVNVFVGVFNLVPLLPLDGGHIAIATYERLRSRGGRRHVADAAKLAPLTWAVVAFLIALALIALYRDIVDPFDFG